MACPYKDPADRVAAISQLQDEVSSCKATVHGLLKDDGALHRKLKKDKALETDSTSDESADNHVHLLLWRAGNLLSELRDAKSKLAADTDVEFDQFAESQIERELDQERLLSPGDNGGDGTSLKPAV